MKIEFGRRTPSQRGCDHVPSLISLMKSKHCKDHAFYETTILFDVPAIHFILQPPVSNTYDFPNSLMPLTAQFALSLGKSLFSIFPLLKTLHELQRLHLLVVLPASLISSQWYRLVSRRVLTKKAKLRASAHLIYHSFSTHYTSNFLHPLLFLHKCPVQERDKPMTKIRLLRDHLPRWPRRHNCLLHRQRFPLRMKRKRSTMILPT